MKKYRAVETQSLILPQLMAEYRMLTSAVEKQQWRSSIQTPLIEMMDDDPDHCRVTFFWLQDHHDHSRDADKQYRQCSW